MKNIFSFVLILTLITLNASAHAADSVLDRVQKTKILRCGYVIYEPFLKKDLNTGKMSGITVEYFEKVVARKNLTIEWTQEYAPDQVVTALNAGRFDMACVPYSPMPDLEKVIDFVGSFGAMPYYVYVPLNSELNSEQLKTANFAAMDGFIPSVETPVYFPQAKLKTLPQTASIAELFDQLKFGKADAVVNEHISASNYMASNPDTIRRVAAAPLFTKIFSFPVKKDDKAWGAFVREMTDTTTPENKAIFLDLVKKYGVTEDSLLPAKGR